MKGAGPDPFLIGEKILGEERRAETEGRTGWMFLSWTRSGRLRRMAVFSFLPRTFLQRTLLPRTFLPRTVARTWFGSFCIGCPAGDRRTNHQNNGYRLANLPPEFVEEKHALDWPVRLGSLMGTACESEWQDCSASILRGRLQVVSIDLHCHALHDHVQREHNPKVAFLADQHAFHPGHRSGLDTDPLTDDKIRMGLDVPLSDTRAECLDFKIG